MGHRAIKYRSSLYADDAVLFAHPSAQEFRVVAEILKLFGAASGLQVNLGKCSLTPMFGCQDILPMLQAILPCEVTQFPIRYLGLSLSTKKIPKSQLQPLVDKVVAKLPLWQGPVPARGSRLVLIKAVLCSIPVYVLMAEQLPPWAIHELDSTCRRFFWAGADSSDKGKCQVSTEVVCSPKEHGGLDIPNFRLTGYALQLRWLWLQRTAEERAWAELNLKIDPMVRAFFEAPVQVQIGNGKGQRTLFWADRWLQGQPLFDLAPGVNAVPPRIRKRRTVAEALQDRQWIRDVRGSRTVQVIIEFIHLRQRIEATSLDTNPDRFNWRWTANGQYTAWSAYEMLHKGKTYLEGADRIWQHRAPLRVNMFLWLAAHRRLWTADRRHRHNLEATEMCPLYHQELETSDHILVNCSFAKSVWWEVLRWAGCTCPFVPEATLQDWWSHLLRQQAPQRRKGLHTLVMLIAWSLWKERNARVFDSHCLPSS